MTVTNRLNTARMFTGMATSFMLVNIAFQIFRSEWGFVIVTCMPVAMVGYAYWMLSGIDLHRLRSDSVLQFIEYVREHGIGKETSDGN